jgi:hypothetical protein
MTTDRSRPTTAAGRGGDAGADVGRRAADLGAVGTSALHRLRQFLKGHTDRTQVATIVATSANPCHDERRLSGALDLLQPRLRALSVIAREVADRATVDVPAPPASDPAAQLAALKAMLDQGLLTQEDYEAKKAELLSRM